MSSKPPTEPGATPVTALRGERSRPSASCGAALFRLSRRRGAAAVHLLLGPRYGSSCAGDAGDAGPAHAESVGGGRPIFGLCC